MSADNSSAGIANSRRALVVLVSAYIPISLVSLCFALDYTTHRFAYDPQWFPYAVVSGALFGLIAALFVLARFSFGYFIAFYLYTMSLGFIWLSWFTSFGYDLETARLSAAASTIAFLLPALFWSAPLPLAPRLSQHGFEVLLGCLLPIAAVAVVIGASQNFRLVGLASIQDFRPTLGFPAWAGYLINIVESTVCPFLFACFVVRRQPWHACITLMLLALFYPVTLTKTAFFAPAWLIGIAVLSRFLEARAATILTLLLPQLVGIVLLVLLGEQARSYFDVVNFRMLAVPSSGLNVYGDFFSRHELTHFCQITLLKKLVACPYDEPLYVVIERGYGLGFFNASLFATEGIASVGMKFAPIAVFVCGLIIAVGNGASRHLPPRFILISSAMLVRLSLDVPLSILMVTHGGALLFLLWYLTPSTLFAPRQETFGQHEGATRSSLTV